VYISADTKYDKTNVIATLIHKVRGESPHGGFVKKDFYSGRWFEIGMERARDKVGHAVRKAADDILKEREGKGKKKSKVQAKSTEAIQERKVKETNQSYLLPAPNEIHNDTQSEYFQGTSSSMPQYTGQPTYAPVYTNAGGGAFPSAEIHHSSSHQELGLQHGIPAPTDVHNAPSMLLTTRYHPETSSYTPIGGDFLSATSTRNTIPRASVSPAVLEPSRNGQQQQDNTNIVSHPSYLQNPLPLPVREFNQPPPSSVPNTVGRISSYHRLEPIPYELQQEPPLSSQRPESMPMPDAVFLSEHMPTYHQQHPHGQGTWSTTSLTQSTFSSPGYEYTFSGPPSEENISDPEL